MNSQDERILDDLSKHLREKIALNLTDYVSLCRSARLDYSSAMAELMTVLISLTSSLAADQFHISPAEFAKMMGRHFGEFQRRAQAEDE